VSIEGLLKLFCKCADRILKLLDLFGEPAHVFNPTCVVLGSNVSDICGGHRILESRV
jgi:hypothetical protein